MAEMRSVAVEGLERPISKIGLGTWQFGSREWGYGKDYADGEAGRIVRRALELGVTLFDSAEIYGFGASERILGAALGERRTEVVLATKLFPLAPLPAVVRHRARASARRLGVDRIDLYQIHWPNPIVPLGQTMRGLRELVDAGVVAEVGVSNFDLARWKRAEEELGRRVLSDQVQYSLLARGPERELIPWA
jgi:aryl-alcohol dehydrogenase-like predicted oxidoreductase